MARLDRKERNQPKIRRPKRLRKRAFQLLSIGSMLLNIYLIWGKHG